jgi:hypothetical protein
MNIPANPTTEGKETYHEVKETYWPNSLLFREVGKPRVEQEANSKIMSH